MYSSFTAAVSSHALVSEDLVGAALLELQQNHNIHRQDLFLQTK